MNQRSRYLGNKRQARDHQGMGSSIPVVQLTFPSFRSPGPPLQRALSLSMQGRHGPTTGATPGHHLSAASRHWELQLGFAQAGEAELPFLFSDSTSELPSPLISQYRIFLYCLALPPPPDDPDTWRTYLIQKSNGKSTPFTQRSSDLTAPVDFFPAVAITTTIPNVVLFRLHPAPRLVSSLQPFGAVSMCRFLVCVSLYMLKSRHPFCQDLRLTTFALAMIRSIRAATKRFSPTSSSTRSIPY